jgi:hypothetical protein
VFLISTLDFPVIFDEKFCNTRVKAVRLNFTLTVNVFNNLVVHMWPRLSDVYETVLTS